MIEQKGNHGGTERDLQHRPHLLFQYAIAHTDAHGQSELPGQEEGALCGTTLTMTAQFDKKQQEA